MDIFKLVIMYLLFGNGLTTFSKIIGSSRKLNLYMRKAKQTNTHLYVPKSENQIKYVEYLNDNANKIIISVGPAGTGKTLFSCQKAICQLKNEEINRIIITRPLVTVEEELGFLPGNIVSKMDPWTKPIFDIFMEYYSKQDIDLMVNNGKIEICPLAFMRGRTFKNSFILADEMQNSSPNQMKMLLTRIGVNSRLVITGDLNQTDIKGENGLNDFVSKTKAFNETKLIKVINFENGDIERSEIVQKVIEIYNYVKPKPSYKLNYVIDENYTTSYTNGDAALMPIQHITKKRI